MKLLKVDPNAKPVFTEFAPQLCGNFEPLDKVSTPTVGTDAAAHYLHRKPQTLRMWACKECGPMRPLRINGRLHWSVADLRLLLGVV